MKTAYCASILAVLWFGNVNSWPATVYVRDTGFSPASVSINVGGTVVFVVADDNGPYCIQSTIGAWPPWYLWEYGDSQGFTFNEKGDYYYRDAFTYNSGVIHVGTGTPNLPPSIDSLSPSDGTVFTEPASFSFSGNVSDPDNGVMAVEFYVGANLVDTLFAAPFSTQVNNLPAGRYQLTIVAYDYASLSASNSVSITVHSQSARSISCCSPRLVGGYFHFDVSGVTPGKQVVLEGKNGLGYAEPWAPLQTTNSPANMVSFRQPVAPGAMFFRVMEEP